MPLLPPFPALFSSARLASRRRRRFYPAAVMSVDVLAQGLRLRADGRLYRARRATRAFITAGATAAAVRGADAAGCGAQHTAARVDAADDDANRGSRAEFSRITSRARR